MTQMLLLELRHGELGNILFLILSYANTSLQMIIGNTRNESTVMENEVHINFLCSYLTEWQTVNLHFTFFPALQVL